jgi:hypothetical protein
MKFGNMRNRTSGWCLRHRVSIRKRRRRIAVIQIWMQRFVAEGIQFLREGCHEVYERGVAVRFPRSRFWPHSGWPTMLEEYVDECKRELQE